MLSPFRSEPLALLLAHDPPERIELRRRERLVQWQREPVAHDPQPLLTWLGLGLALVLVLGLGLGLRLGLGSGLTLTLTLTLTLAPAHDC